MISARESHSLAIAPEKQVKLLHSPFVPQYVLLLGEKSSLITFYNFLIGFKKQKMPVTHKSSCLCKLNPDRN